MTTAVPPRAPGRAKSGLADTPLEPLPASPPTRGTSLLPGRTPGSHAPNQRRSSARIHFLMFTADGADGVCRSAINLANHLSQTHRVEIISLYRRRARPAYSIDDRIQVSYLLDRRPGPNTAPRGVRGRIRTWLAARRSRYMPKDSAAHLSLLTDAVLTWKLRRLRAGVLITTRPTLHLMSARIAPKRLITIGQDHLNYEFRAREKGTLEVIDAAAHHGLDAFVTLTHSDEADYRRLFGVARTTLTTIPNALSWPLSASSPLDGRTIVTAGRLVKRKGVDRLIKAYLPIAREHPDWQLHIYGKGALHDELQHLIDQHGVGDQIILKGHTPDLASALEKASVFASASRGEGFPMVLLEAMSKGLPLVSFDCPRGPADIIRDGENGRLVPNGDIPALTEALRELIESRETRRRMGSCARAGAEEFTIDRIAGQWEALFDVLIERRRRRTRPIASRLELQAK